MQDFDRLLALRGCQIQEGGENMTRVQFKKLKTGDLIRTYQGCYITGRRSCAVTGNHHGILTPVTNTRRVLKNPLTAPGDTVEVDRRRATKPSMSRN
jgi:hypothetical protein